MKGFNLRNGRLTQSGKDQDQGSCQLQSQPLIILKRLLKFLGISGAPGNLPIEFLICSNNKSDSQEVHLDTTLKIRAVHTLPCLSFSMDF